MSTDSNSTPQTHRYYGDTIRHNGSLEMGQYERQQLRDAKQGRANARTEAVRANASLPQDSWTVVDQAVYDTYEDVVRLVNDLRSAGLVTETDIMAKFDHWNVVDAEGNASMDMDPETAEAESTVGFDQDGVPVPIFHDDFSLGFRDSPANSEAVGESLDTLGPTVSARLVSELIEATFIGNAGGTPFSVGNGDMATLYGMTNHPSINTGSTGSDWEVDSSGARGDLRAMRSVLKSDNNVRPGGTGYWTYFGSSYWDELDDIDADGSGDLLLRDRVENLSNITLQGELDFLPDKSILMFRPTEDVVDVGVASDIQAVQWESPFRDHWKTMASIYPRVKSTSSGQSGIAFYTAP